MSDSDFSDTQKKDFFKECENLTFTEILLFKAYARFFRLKRIFRQLKNRLWVA